MVDTAIKDPLSILIRSCEIQPAGYQEAKMDLNHVTRLRTGLMSTIHKKYTRNRYHFLPHSPKINMSGLLHLVTTHHLRQTRYLRECFP